MGENSNNSDKHAYYANAIGLSFLFLSLAFGVKSCSDVMIEGEKTEQIKIIHGVKSK